jgi:hypothetical protein
MLAMRELSARSVATLAKPGRHADGGNLYLVIDKSGSKRWVFMFKRGGRRREAGLGSALTVPLAKARALAAEFRESLAAGLDPIQVRQAERKAREGRMTFGEVADAFISAKEAAWRNVRHARQWRVWLTTYAAPLREMPIDEVDTTAVLQVLTPIWRDKPETASKLRSRIEAVLDSAKAQGLRVGENPARWRGHLAHVVPKRPALARRHHAAMPYSEVPGFVARLREQNATRGRSVWRALGRNRSRREIVDNLTVAHEVWPRAPRSAIRASAGDPRKARRGKDRLICFFWLSARQALMCNVGVNVVAASWHRVYNNDAWISIEFQRLGW